MSQPLRLGVAGLGTVGVGLLRLLQSSDYTSVRLKIDTELARELENVMSGYLKYLLEKEVKSAAWLETLREERVKFSRTTLP